MSRAAFLTLPAFVLLTAGAFAGDPAPDPKPSPTPAKSKVAAKKTQAAADAKSEKTSPALDQLFDKNPVIRQPDVHIWGAAETSFTIIRK
jgi:hypothetical protein